MDTLMEVKPDLKKLQNLPIIDLENPNKKYTEKEEKYLRELVNYEFRNLEEVGHPVQFSYGSAKNKHNFTFLDGGKYMLPRFLARYIESKSLPIWDWKPDGSGRLIKYIKTRKSRFQMREVL